VQIILPLLFYALKTDYGFYLPIIAIPMYF